MTQHGQLDPTDLKIMAILQENARLDIVRIANRVHKSPTSTKDRIVKLQELGYIQKYVAVLNRKLVGRPVLMVTLVKLVAHTSANLSGFYLAMNDLAEVQVCLHLSGKFDFLLQVTLREPSDTEVARPAAAGAT